MSGKRERDVLYRREFRNRPAMKTKIEALIGRELEREKRAGVDHFKTGQHHAELWVDEDGKPDEVEGESPLYELVFVDNGGNAWLLGCVREHRVWNDYRWVPVFAFRGGQTYLCEATPPTLSARMLQTLNKALDGTS